jgi:hypothetical protein
VAHRIPLNQPQPHSLWILTTLRIGRCHYSLRQPAAIACQRPPLASRGRRCTTNDHCSVSTEPSQPPILPPPSRLHASTTKGRHPACNIRLFWRTSEACPPLRDLPIASCVFRSRLARAKRPTTALTTTRRCSSHGWQRRSMFTIATDLGGDFRTVEDVNGGSR